MSNITGISISGPVVANLAEAVTQVSTVNNKVVTPSILQQFMKSIPVTIGSFIPCDANFKNLNFNSISGSVLASNSEANDSSITNKLITPSTLMSVISSGLPIGTGTPSTGKFSDVTITNSITILNDKIQTNEGGTGFNSYTRGDLLAAEAATQLVKVPIGKNGQYLTVDNGVPGSIRWTTPQSVVNATTSTSGIVVLASSSEVLSGISNSKVITPAGLVGIFKSPPIIGSNTPNDAHFNNVTVTSLTGCAATNYEASTKSISNKYLVPANIKSIMSSPGPIGGNTASSGVFTTLNATTITASNLNIANPPWANSIFQFASNSESVKGVVNNKSISPSSLKTTLRSPPEIGSEDPNAATFTDLTVNTITINGTPPWSSITPVFASDDEVIQYSITDKVLAPSNLIPFAGSPPSIGDVTSNSGTFTILKANKYIGQVGDDFGRNDGYFNSITVSSISGDVIAIDQDIIDNTSTTKLLTPSNLINIFANNNPIGSQTPNTGVFTLLSSESLMGSVIATDDIVSSGISNNTVVTPLTLRNQLASPTSIGSVDPNTGSFTILNCESIYGNVLSSVDDLQQGLANDKVITPNILRSFILNPGPIGTQSPNVGSFTDLYADNLFHCQANLQDAQDGILETKFISPKTLSDFFDQPNIIGNITKNDGHFLGLTADTIVAMDLSTSSIKGDVIATNDEIKQGVIDNKVVTPASLYTALESPIIIGLVNPNAANFTNVICESVSGDVIGSINDMTSNTTIVTPNLLLNFLTSPSIIGQSNPNDGYFKEIHSNVIYSELGSTSITNNAYIKTAQIESLIGECQADYDDIIKGTAIDKVISPAILQSVFNEPPIIGLTQANNALFTNIDANSISGNVLADLNDIYGNTTVNNKLITPITLTEYLSDIKQDMQGQEAKFTKVVSSFSGQVGDLHDSYDAYTDNLYANYINGSVISTLLEVQNGNEERKVISPVILKSFLSNPTYQIGDGTSGSSCYLDTLQGNQIFGTIGSQSQREDVFGNNADFNRFQGSGVTNPVDIMTKTAIGSQIVTLDALNIFFEYPNDIGGQTPANGTFTTLKCTIMYGDIGDSTTRSNISASVIDCNTITGDVCAIYDDFITLPLSTSKVVTPSTFIEFINSPTPIGLTTPSTGNFTNITSDTIFGELGNPSNVKNAFIDELSAKSIIGDCQASTSDLQNGPGTLTSVVSSYVLKDFLSQPNGFQIGDGSGDASFNNLVTKSISGSVIANQNDILQNIEDKVITPDLLNQFLSNLPSTFTIGGSANIVANNLNANVVTGTMIANVSDIIGDLSQVTNERIVTPLSLREYLLNPEPIGSSDYTIGNFNQLNCKNMYGQLGDDTTQSNIYANDINANTISGDFIANYSDYQTSNTNKVVTPSLLNQVLNDPINIGNNNTTGTFDSLTVNSITILNDTLETSVGGTGMSLYKKGDLLVGTAGQSLTTIQLPVSNCMVLQTDLTTNNGIKWDQTPYPNGYIKHDTPVYSTPTTFKINYCYARDSTHMHNINLESKTIDFYYSGYNGFTQSGELGTCSGTGSQIVFNNIDPTTLFVKGDNIYITSTNECKRIMSVSSLNIVLESSLSTNFTDSTFKRGGISPNTHYYVYATPFGYLCSTRSEYNDDPIVDFPTSIYKQLSCVLSTNDTAVFRPYTYNNGTVLFTSIPTGNTFSLTNNYVSYSLGLLIPKNANLVTLRVRLYSGTSNNDVYINASGSQSDYINLGNTPSGLLNSQTLQVSMDTSKRIYAKILSTNNGSWADVTILGYSL